MLKPNKFTMMRHKIYERNRWLQQYFAINDNRLKSRVKYGVAHTLIFLANCLLLFSRRKKIVRREMVCLRVTNLRQYVFWACGFVKRVLIYIMTCSLFRWFKIYGLENSKKPNLFSSLSHFYSIRLFLHELYQFSLPVIIMGRKLNEKKNEEKWSGADFTTTGKWVKIHKRKKSY